MFSFARSNCSENVCDERFVRMAQAMGMEDCGVAELKMSDYGIKPEEFDEMAKNARETMGGLFMCDRTPLSHQDCVAIYEKSYK